MCKTMNTLWRILIVISLMLAISGCSAEEKLSELETAESLTKETMTEETMDTSFGVAMSEEEVNEFFGIQEKQEKEDIEIASVGDNKANVQVETKNPQKAKESTAVDKEPTKAEARPDYQPETQPKQELVETQPKQEQLESTSKQEQIEYERYMAMSGDEQYAFYQSFDSPDDFINWLNMAQAEYERKFPTKELNGTINIEEIIESQN